MSTVFLEHVHKMMLSFTLCRYVMPADPTSASAIIIKIILDRLLFTPVNMAALFLFNGLLEGQSLQKILVTASHRQACL
jgi:hypothetical protein